MRRSRNDKECSLVPGAWHPWGPSTMARVVMRSLGLGLGRTAGGFYRASGRDRMSGRSAFAVVDVVTKRAQDFEDFSVE